jgi:hypothetical protein
VLKLYPDSTSFFLHLKVCQKRLRILVKADYLRSVNVPRVSGGRCQKLFYLGNQGASLLGVSLSKPRFTLQLSHQNKNSEHLVNVITSFKNKEDIQCEVMPEHMIRVYGERIIPDGVFMLRKNDRTALFCIENDCGTEVIKSPTYSSDDIENKCLRYLEQFESNNVKLYESYLTETFNRFRVLLICTNIRRLDTISNLLADEKFHFIWLTTISEFNKQGICGGIWNVPSLNESNLSII